MDEKVMVGEKHAGALRVVADQSSSYTIRLDSEGWRFLQTEQIYCGPQDRG